MERLKTIKDVLIAQVQSQLGNLQQVDANELGEVVDMIKDIEEAIYYCTITKAMEQSEKDYLSKILLSYYQESYNIMTKGKK